MPESEELVAYRYAALDRQGKPVGGVIEADSIGYVATTLEKMGFEVQFIRIEKDSKLKEWILSLPFGPKLYSTTKQIIQD